MAAKDHAKSCDQYLGFDLVKCETLVRARKFDESLSSKETWSHLDPQVFQTSYLEWRAILELLHTGSKNRIELLDLGAGYGRGGIVMSRHYPQSIYRGLECVRERVEEANRVYLRNQVSGPLLEVADLASDSFWLPDASHFFIYDMGTARDLELVLEKLREKKFRYLVIARGARVRHIIESKLHWLSIVPMESVPNENFSIYQSAYLTPQP